MRVLHLAHFFPPQHNAGVEVYTHRLARAQAKAHTVAVMFTEKVHGSVNYSVEERAYPGFTGFALTNNLLYRHVQETWSNGHVERQVEQVVDQFNPDLVHVQHLMLLSLGVLERIRQRRIPVIMTIHDFWLFCARMGQLLDHSGKNCPGPEPGRCATCLSSFKFGQSRIERTTIQAIAWTRKHLGWDLGPRLEEFARRRRKTAVADSGGAARSPLAPGVNDLQQRELTVKSALQHVGRFLVPGESTLRQCVEYGLPADRCEHLPNGFVPPGGEPTAATETGKLRIGFFGTLAPHKGAHVLVEAFHLADLNSAELHIHGSDRSHPAYGLELKRMAQGARVHFHGLVPQEQLATSLSSLDVVVVPSVWRENAPVVIQEARWARVPVVASRLGGMEEAVRHDVDGLLFEPGDASSLARVLGELAQRPDKLRRYREASPTPMPMEEHLARLQVVYDQARRQESAQ